MIRQKTRKGYCDRIAKETHKWEIIGDSVCMHIVSISSQLSPKTVYYLGISKMRERCFQKLGDVLLDEFYIVPAGVKLSFGSQRNRNLA